MHGWEKEEPIIWGEFAWLQVGPKTQFQPIPILPAAGPAKRSSIDNALR